MRVEEGWPNQTVRRGLGKSQHGGAFWGWLRGTGWWRAGLWLCGSCGGGSAGQVLHSQGSLGRRCYRADALGGSVATILCSFRSCPAAAAFYGVVGKELLQNGLWVVYEATQTTLPP